MSANPSSRGGGVDLPTLAVTAAASAAAAYACSKVWAPGTLGAAATMPVLVALLKEAFARPTYAVARAVPVRGVVRSAGGPQEPDPPPPVVDERIAQQGEVAGSSRSRPQRAWKMAVATGLLGFLIAAVIITVPEFVAGSSASGGDRQTTFFGGDKDSSDAEEDTTTTTTPDETQTAPPAGTVTVPPVETTTVPPAETTTVPPTQTDPLPGEEPAPGPAPEENAP